MIFSQEQDLIGGHVDGHALIGAGPGTGKTTTMARLIGNLMNLGKNPKKMLVLMFGHDPKVQFEQKLDSMKDGDNIVMPEVRTFNSVGNGLCLAFEKKGLIKKRRLETREKPLEMMAMKALRGSMSDAHYKRLQGEDSKIVEVFVGFIDRVKSCLLEPGDVYDMMGLPAEYERSFVNAFHSFEEIRDIEGVRFFSDQLYDSVRCIRDNPDMQEWVSNKKEYIIVDEFQDTNSIQYELLKYIAGEKANVIAVGDLKQSIFEWRGSDIELMMSIFEKDFKNPTKYSLSKTFRFGPEISMMANSIISSNPESSEGICVSNETNGNSTFDIVMSNNPGKEALKIVKQALAKGRKLSDIAIVCRLYSSAAPIELELLANDIPVGTASNFGALDSAEFKAIRHLLELSSGKFATMSENTRKEKFIDILKFPHMGLKNDQVEYIAGMLSRESQAYGHKLRNVRVKGIAPYLISKVTDRGWMLSDIEKSGQLKKNSSRIISSYIAETGLEKSIMKMAMSQMEGTEKVDRIKFISEFIKSNDGAPDEVLAQIDSIQNIKDSTKRNREDKVLITSIHKAKGLEYPVVIVPGLDSGRFPYEIKGDFKSQSSTASERRLFYVGITRAIEECYVLAPNDRELESFISSGKDRGSVSKFFNNGEASSFLFETDYVTNKENAQLFIDNKDSDNKLLVEYREHLRKVA